MRRRWSDERRSNQQQADWIVAWLRDNGPATIRQIVQALTESGRDVKALIILSALSKSQGGLKSGEINVGGETQSLWDFSIN